jgi:hypothetical protein
MIVGMKRSTLQHKEATMLCEEDMTIAKAKECTFNTTKYQTSSTSENT